MMAETNELQDKLHENTDYFMDKMKNAGFDLKPTQSAIVAIMYTMHNYPRNLLQNC